MIGIKHAKSTSFKVSQRSVKKPRHEDYKYKDEMLLPTWLRSVHIFHFPFYHGFHVQQLGDATTGENGP